jgi:hypothetical protein
MNDIFSSNAPTMSGPGRDYAPVTLSDTVDLATLAIALYVETGGAVSFISAAGTTRTVAVPDFGWILCGVRRVRATGTTAVGIHAVTIS